MSLCEYELVQNGLSGTVADVVHATDPHHLILPLEFFCHAFLLSHLFNKPKDHFLRLFIDIGKIILQLALDLSFVEFQDEEFRDNLPAVAEASPKRLLIDEKQRLFDEWQDEPKLWGAIRKDVDDTGESGQYIFTCSFGIQALIH